MNEIAILLMLAAAPAIGPAVPVLTATPVPLPGGAAGIGFDDLGFSPTLKKLLVPAGRTGNLDLIDPRTSEVVPIGGFSSTGSFAGGHGEGTTSVDEGRGLLFATERTSASVVVVDAATRTIVARAALASESDYVRFVAPTGEVWITEPDKERIEIFSLPASGTPTPAHAAFITIPGGPEALLIDAARGRAYTHLWKGSTLAIDIRKREMVRTWTNGCDGSRGIAMDAKRGFLFVGCAEGKAVTIDLDKDGAVLDSLSHGSGVDIISYNAELGHLYLPGGRSATMAILGVASTGRLTLLGTVKTANRAHCVVSDDQRQAWVCDPERGQLLLVRDSLPAVDTSGKPGTGNPGTGNPGTRNPGK